ncbi:MAG: ABC transporter permease, partial [Leptothrix sp. (in: b-proteobacteria)]
MLVAVALAVASLTAVGFFADRLQAGMARDAQALLGGDAVVASDQPLPPDFARTAAEMGLAAAQTASFPSMARAADAQGGATRLVSVKSVGAAYPLRGTLQLAPNPTAPMAATQRAPAPGTVWVDPAVLDALALKVGDALLLGDATLRIAAVISAEPDRGASFVNFAPRVMLAEADLAATALVQPASRITWRLAVAAHDGRGQQSAVKGFVSWAEGRIDAARIRGARVESLDGARPEMRQTLDRA